MNPPKHGCEKLESHIGPSTSEIVTLTRRDMCVHRESTADWTKGPQFPAVFLSSVMRRLSYNSLQPFACLVAFHPGVNRGFSPKLTHICLMRRSRTIGTCPPRTLRGRGVIARYFASCCIFMKHVATYMVSYTYKIDRYA
jgi:hypothetical protein